MAPGHGGGASGSGGGGGGAGQASGDLERALEGQLWLLIAHLQRCDIGGVDRAVRSYTVLAERSRQPRHRFVALTRQAMRAFLAGAYEDGERLAAEARTVGRADGEPDAEIVYHGLRALPHLAAGTDMSELEEVFRAFSAEHTSVGSRCLLALFACARGASAEAQARLDELAGDDDRFSAVPVDMDWLLCLCLLTEVAARTGDRARCDALYALLTPFAGRGAQVAGAVSFAGAVDQRSSARLPVPVTERTGSFLRQPRGTTCVRRRAEGAPAPAPR